MALNNACGWSVTRQDLLADPPPEALRDEIPLGGEHLHDGELAKR